MNLGDSVPNVMYGSLPPPKTAASISDRSRHFMSLKVNEQENLLSLSCLLGGRGRIWLVVRGSEMISKVPKTGLWSLVSKFSAELNSMGLMLSLYPSRLV